GWPCHCERVNRFGAEEASEMALCDKEECDYKKFWPGVQVCGKDNLRQQTAIWQAMLMSAGLPNSKQVLVFGFISADGQKMSKTLGNVVNPYDIVEKYGTDAVRYCLLKEIKPFSDSDYSEDKFKNLYNADLANGLGNLVARVSNLLEKNDIEIDIKPGSDNILKERFEAEMDGYRFDLALEVLWAKIRESDEFLSEKKPWKMEDKSEIKNVLEPIAQNILNISIYLESFMPETASKIAKQFSEKKVKKEEPLFMRLS
ncbi:class I tRNA ligase family protein, partial [Candidatus Falkowbacteria bacterium]|nr:class I tRNA ligase family protein [Candidatus Falkowbacteria bacterium]